MDCLTNADVYPTVSSSILQKRPLAPVFARLRLEMSDNTSSSSESSSPSSYFPFDGSCDCSRDGDLTLNFADGSSLKTHAALLKMASPTFKAMLTDCAETGTVALENTSREAWVLILNCLHPGTRNPFSNFDPIAQTDLLVRTL